MFNFLRVRGVSVIMLSIVSLMCNSRKISAQPSIIVHELLHQEVSNEELENKENFLEQVTSVSQLSDVNPTDWAFQALQSLVERYGCLQGYPDRSFRGNRSITRYEFAASTSICLERIGQIVSDKSQLVKKEDLIQIEQLQRIFRVELASLAGRTNSLGVRTDTLEKQKFSTTSKLFGQVVIGLQGRFANRADFFPVDSIKDIDDPGRNVNLITNTQLSLLTQFNPSSLLLVGLQAGSGSTSPRLNNDVRLGYEGDTSNALFLSDLTYRQRIGDKFAVIVGPIGVSPVSVFRGTNRVESAGSGPLSVFAQRNPIINLGGGRGGVGFDWQISRNFALQGVYSASSPEQSNGGGLFGGQSGSTTLGTQLNVALSSHLDLGLNYLYSYTPKDTFAGRLGTGIGDDQITVNQALLTHGVGGTVGWRASPGFVLGGWAGYTTSRIPDQSGEVTTFNWMSFMNFPDLLGKGNLGGLYIGQPPRITSSTLPSGSNIPNLLAGGPGIAGGQAGATLHTEAFLRYQINDRVSITPGVIVIFNPANTASSDPVVIGALRTTFSF